MKTIEIKECTIEEGMQYIPEQYPGPGIYNVNNGQWLAIIYHQPISPALFAMTIPYIDCSAFLNEEPPAPEKTETPETPKPIEKMVSEEFTLKLIAMTVNNEKYNDI